MGVLNPDIEALLKQRLEQRYAQGKLTNVYTLGKQYTPEDIINEVRMGTSAGEEFLLVEYRGMQELKKRIGQS